MVHSTSKFELPDGPGTQLHDTQVKLMVDNSSFGLALHVSGYGTKEDPNAAPILIENHDGQLRVVLWMDIDCTEPKIIEMGNAKLPK